MKSLPLLEGKSDATVGWYIRPMAAADIPQVQRLEREAFSTMQPRTSFRRELANRLTTYLVACRRQPNAEPQAPGKEEVMGYAGLWFIIDEAHLTSIAVGEAYRRRGIGQGLMVAAFEVALERDAVFMTLEVRASNAEAQSLYEKFGFRRVGVRRGYYTDDREDAYLMTVEKILEAEYRAWLAQQKAALLQPHPVAKD